MHRQAKPIVWLGKEDESDRERFDFSISSRNSLPSRRTEDKSNCQSFLSLISIVQIAGSHAERFQLKASDRIQQ
jgi:hypothetical protein